MDVKLVPIIAELESISSLIVSTIPNTILNVAHNNWSFPAVTRETLVEAINLLITDLKDITELPPSVGSDIISQYAQGLTYMKVNTIPNVWANAQIGVGAVLDTVTGLRQTFLPSSLTPKPPKSYFELQNEYKNALTRTRSIEKRLNSLTPRTDQLETYMQRIESAYTAADNLPTDLEELSEAKTLLKNISDNSLVLQSGIDSALKEAISKLEHLKDLETEAVESVKEVHSAYAAATSQGLALAFAERSNGLTISMRYWVGGFIASLCVGAYFGIQHLTDLTALISNPNASLITIGLNLLLSILSVAAPGWFAWMAAKSIGHRFRLAEDYAFKAAISRAYEGYRRETVRVGEGLEAKLLRSALDRLDEQPLRFVDSANHASPIHELASSDLAKGMASTIGDAVSATKTLATKIASEKFASSEDLNKPSKD